MVANDQPARRPAYPRQRGDRWELRAYLGRDPDTGKGQFLYGSFRGGSRGAKAAQAALVRQAAAARGKAAPRPAPRSPKDRSGRTVADAVEAWLNAGGGHWEPNTADHMRRHANLYILPRLGDVQLWRLRGELDDDTDDDDPLVVSLTDFYAELHASGAHRGGGLSWTTIETGPHRVLRGSLRLAVRRGWLDSNPASEVRLSKKATRRPSTTPPAGTLFAFFDFLANWDPALYAWVELMNSGARRVDLGVKWKEWNAAEAEVTLGARGVIKIEDDDAAPDGPPGRGRGGGRRRHKVVVRDNPTSKRRLRKVALSRAANEALIAHRDREEARARLAGLAGLNPEGFMFSPLADGSQPRWPDWATLGFRDARRAAAAAGMVGMDQCRLYDVRHFMGTEMLAAGVEGSVLAERMGNSLATIDRFYRHAAPAKDREAADVMDALRAQTRAGRPATAKVAGRRLRVVPLAESVGGD